VDLGGGVIVSLNEIETTLLKAARGAGYGWGVAEEAGAAARWLAQHDLPWAETAAAILTENAVRLVGTDRAMSNPLVAGTSSCDWISEWSCDDPPAEGDTRRGLTAVLAPLWLAAVIGVCGRGSETHVSLEWRGAALGIGRGALSGARGNLIDPGPVDVSIQVSRPATAVPVPARASAVGGYNVDETIWHALNKLVKRTYVPASFRSREMGAGAGTSDND